MFHNQYNYIQSFQIRLGSVLRSDYRPLAGLIVLRRTHFLAFKHNRSLAVEAITLELQRRHSIFVQEVELLNRKTLHLGNNEEHPSNCDERERSPYETLQ
jgi:hypothetical protein